VLSWTFLSNHGRALLCIARDPDARLRDVAADLGITERRAYGIVNDLSESGYIVKSREGRRNRYELRLHLPLPESTSSQRTLGEVLELLSASDLPAERLKTG
jgi:DNA-binding IclR family transcriptional regulator